MSAQQNWVGNYNINNTSFDGQSDSLKITIDIYSPLLTLTSNESGLVSCSIRFSSPWIVSDSGLKGDYLDFNLLFQKAIADKHRYFAAIPSKMLKNGLYQTEFIVSFDGGVSFSNYNIDTYRFIVVGNQGVGGINTSLTINSDPKTYSFMDINRENEFMPDHLEGIYPSGFCVDEYIEFNSLSVLFWSARDVLSADLFYSIDDGGFMKIGDFVSDDDSGDGKVSFNGKSYLFGNTEIKLSVIRFETEIKDLLKKINLNGNSEHRIRFYFKINTENAEYTYPDNNSLIMKFKVVNSPTGADCQAALLPIDLLYWDVLRKEKIVYFKWGTALEVNNDYFEIERSTDASNWKPIKQIKGNGNSKEIHHYNAIDDYPLEGENYYRLKQSDFDGSHKYSKVRIIKNFENELIMYPNPVIDNLFYKVTEPSKKFIIEIADLSGKAVRTFKVPEDLKINGKIDLSNLKEGIYLLKYINTQTNQVKLHKLIKL